MGCHEDCGLCCEAISIRTPARQVSYILGENDDFDWREDMVFFRAHWTPLTREEAHAINPHLVALDDAMDRDWNARKPEWALDHWGGNQSSYWTCSAYDRETRRCSAYEARPTTCSAFPWYGSPKPTALTLAAFPGCGYADDVPHPFPELTELVMA